MNNHFLKLAPACALLLAGSLAMPPAFADRGPGNRGHASAESERTHRDGGERNQRGDRGRDARHDDDRDRHGNRHFDDRHQRLARDYYVGRGLRCPPGLYKRHNDCLPPGQARRWQVGQVLPRTVIFYELEPTLLRQFGPPPSRHRYVRVAGDILLIAIGTGLVVDAIEDLGAM